MVEFCYRNVFLLLVFSLLSACSPFSSKQPSVLLVMLESFSEQDFICSNHEIISSLEHLKESCGDLFRFTHVFAPTDLTQPNISSVLSQLPVKEHGVIHNGPVAISAKVTTLAEHALSQKMRTGFFSGGIPLVPKFGLSQGYEVFNDGFGGKNKESFRPLNKTIERVFSWLDNEVKERPFFLNLYAPDLFYGDRVTTGPEGNERPINRRSQLQHLFESLEGLISGLKERKRWSNSHVVILGLGGHKKRLATHNELNSARLRVPFQIKLAESTPHELSKYKEGLMSFDLVGKWVKKLIENHNISNTVEFPTLPLGQFIPQESHWKTWQGLASGPSLGLRTRRFLFKLTPTLQVFDSFEDRLEYSKLSPEVSEPIVSRFDVKNKIKNYFVKLCRGPYDVVDAPCMPAQKVRNNFRSLLKLEELSQNIRDGENKDFDQLVNEAIQLGDMQVLGWLAYRALYLKKWDSLFELGKKAGNHAWVLVAQANLREKPENMTSGCLTYFVGENRKTDNFYKICQDSALRKVVEGFNQLRNKKRPSISFWNQVYRIKSRRRALDVNQKMNFINDIVEPFDFSPSLAELYFFLPGQNFYQELIDG